MKAHEFLEAGIGHMKDRAATYDAPSGERSMEKTVEMFNSLLGDKLREPLTEEDGWNFMQILKLVRSKQGDFKADNYEDGAAYAGLAGEAAAKSSAKITASHGDIITASYRDIGFFAVKGGYSSFKECIAEAKKYALHVRGIVVATKGGGVEFATLFDFNETAASYIEKHRDCRAMIIWVNGMAVYDSFTAKEGDLDRIVGHLKNERD